MTSLSRTSRIGAAVAGLLALACAACTASTPPIAATNAEPVATSEATPTPAPLPTPAPVPTPGLIVFTRVVDGVEQIFVADTDGRNEQQLTNASGASAQARLAVDGSRVVFGRDWRLFAMDIDGSGLEALTEDGVTASFPDLSPDGSQLAFTRTIGPANELVVVDLATGAMETVVSDSSVFAPVWSPDGTQIAFHGDVDFGQDRPRAIFVFDLAAETIEQVTDFDESRFATWSPDGSTLAFHRISATGTDELGRLHRELWAVDLASGEERVLLAEGTVDRSPSWSPVGDQIAFFRDGPSTDDLEILVLDIETGEVTDIGLAGAMPDWCCNQPG